MSKNIGYVGVPPQQEIKNYKKLYPQAKWIDLDVPVSNIPKFESLKFIPETTCSIIQTILANSLYIKPEIIIATTGACKCDSMRFLVSILKTELPNTKIIETQNNDSTNFGFPIATSDLPLRKKIDLITNSIIEPVPSTIKITKSIPKAGFWGVPPYDLSILDLFVENSHVYGWTRCVENKTPHNMELELTIDKNIPIVFYAQSFCQKNILAKNLARKYNGLYVEVDGLMDSSTKAKISAFLELRKCN